MKNPSLPPSLLYRAHQLWMESVPLSRVVSDVGTPVYIYSRARLLENFVEGYRVAARGLVALLKGPLTLKDAARRAITTGERMFLAGEIERREAVSRPIIENAYAAFVDQGYLSRSDGKGWRANSQPFKVVK